MAVSTGTTLLLKVKATANHTSKFHFEQKFKSFTIKIRRFYHTSVLSNSFYVFRGHQRFRLRVTEGGPLPFAFDILSAAFCYGNRCFTNYPEEIPDFFKQTFPEGMSWERSMTFEDGGIAAVSAHIRYKLSFFKSNLYTSVITWNFRHTFISRFGR